MDIVIILLYVNLDTTSLLKNKPNYRLFNLNFSVEVESFYKIVIYGLIKTFEIFFPFYDHSKSPWNNFFLQRYGSLHIEGLKLLSYT